MYTCMYRDTNPNHLPYSVFTSTLLIKGQRTDTSLSSYVLIQKTICILCKPKLFLSNQIHQAAYIRKGTPPWTRTGALQPSHCSYMFLSRLRSCEPVNIESMGRCANSFSAARSKLKCVAARLYSSERGLQKTPTSSVCPRSAQDVGTAVNQMLTQSAKGTPVLLQYPKWWSA